MPELPEVESLVRFLAAQATGKRIERVQPLAISALKTFDPPVDALRGLELTGTGRRGKFLSLDLPPFHLVIHLARAGWLRWRDDIPATPARPGKGPHALRVRFEDGSGFDVTEQGTEKRLAVYVVRSLEDIQWVQRLGIDPLDPAFTVAAMTELMRSENRQIKGALTDQALIAGVGNAYSDEALWMAHLSPFRKAASLSNNNISRLHAALVAVLADAVERSLGLPAAGLKAEKKTGLHVHARKGEPCPRCGDTIREVSFSTKSLQYCPTCQTGGKPLADRRLSRLLK